MVSRTHPIYRFRFASIVLALLVTPLNTRTEATTAAVTSAESNSPVTAETLFSRLVEHDRSRADSLLRYSANRRYEVRNEEGKLRSETEVFLQYQSPDKKEFKILSQTGPNMLQNIIRSLLKLEEDTASGRAGYDNSITPDNYTFELAGKDIVSGYNCFVVNAHAKRNDRCLLEGKIWIEDKEYAIVKIVGRPAKRPSFWIKSADFIRQYQKIGAAWLPLRDETTSQVRLFGKNVLTIDHGNYRLAMRQQSTASVGQDQVSSLDWHELWRFPNFHSL